MANRASLQRWFKTQFTAIMAELISEAVPKAIAGHIDKLGKAHDFAINWKERCQQLEAHNKNLMDENARLLRQILALRQAMEAQTIHAYDKAMDRLLRETQ